MGSGAGGDLPSWLIGIATVLATLLTTKIFEVTYQEFRARISVICEPYLSEGGKSVSWKIVVQRPRYTAGSAAIDVVGQHSSPLSKIKLLPPEHRGNHVISTVFDDGVGLIEIRKWMYGRELAFSAIFDEADIPVFLSGNRHISVRLLYDTRENYNRLQVIIGRSHARLMMMLLLMVGGFLVSLIGLIYLGITYG